MELKSPLKTSLKIGKKELCNIRIEDIKKSQIKAYIKLNVKISGGSCD